MDRATYLLPIKAQTAAGVAELALYLQGIAAASVRVIVVDGSPDEVFAAHARSFGADVTHVAPDAQIAGLNGKVCGVLTGLPLAPTEKIIIADDDVRYTRANLEQMIDALERFDVVRPQNYFSLPAWHATLDQGRSLLNRVSGGDWPGTLGVRKSRVSAGYNPNVLFENLELVRTIRANGGRELVAYGLFIARRPPETAHFLAQRVRQAYDEFARPWRLLAALAILPYLGRSLALRDWRSFVAFVAGAVALAEAGRRRAGATRFFSIWSSLAAPLWLMERGVCAWLALYFRLRHGGVPYAGALIRHAASPFRGAHAK